MVRILYLYANSFFFWVWSSTFEWSFEFSTRIALSQGLQCLHSWFLSSVEPNEEPTFLQWLNFTKQCSWAFYVTANPSSTTLVGPTWNHYLVLKRKLCMRALAYHAQHPNEYYCGVASISALRVQERFVYICDISRDIKTSIWIAKLQNNVFPALPKYCLDIGSIHSEWSCDV